MMPWIVVGTKKSQAAMIPLVDDTYDARSEQRRTGAHQYAKIHVAHAHVVCAAVHASKQGAIDLKSLEKV